MNCYDNFELTSCEIIDESYEGEGEKEIAKVKFVAKMIQVDSRCERTMLFAHVWIFCVLFSSPFPQLLREKTAFMETSKFERAGKHIANGAWLYLEGVIEPAPGMPEALSLEEEETEEDGAATEEAVAEAE